MAVYVMADQHPENLAHPRYFQAHLAEGLLFHAG